MVEGYFLSGRPFEVETDVGSVNFPDLVDRGTEMEGDVSVIALS
jgi:hypothetical protein